MNINIKLTPIRIVQGLTSVLIILSIFNLIVQISKYGLGKREEWMTVFNMDKEMNFPTLYTVILLIICAIILKQISILEKKHQEPLFKYWNILYYIFLFLAFDEALQIHEIFIFRDIGTNLPGIFHFVWVIPYGIAVCFLVLYFAKFTFSLPRRISNLFILSGGIYIGGALGMEMVEGLWVRIAAGRQNLVYSLLASVEEMMEIMGLIIFIYSLIIYITKCKEEIISIKLDVK